MVITPQNWQRQRTLNGVTYLDTEAIFMLPRLFVLES